MKSILSVFVMLFISTAATTALASPHQASAGRYQIKVAGLFNYDIVDFSVTQSGQIKVNQYTGDESLGQPQLSWGTTRLSSPYGPAAFSVETLSLVVGSDEETHAFIIRLGRLGDAPGVLTVIDGLYTINDRVNAVTEATLFRPDMDVWNPESGAFQPLPGSVHH